MKRRAFLLMAGAGLLGSAGCLGASSGGNNKTIHQTTEPSPTQRTKSTTFLRGLNTTGLEQSPTQQTPLETETPSNVGQVEDASWSAEESPQITGRIGKRSQLEEGDRPHLIQIWNDASTTRTIHFSLASINNLKQPTFEEEYQLKADSYANLELMISDDFVVEAGIGAGSTRLVTKIPSDLVDCNESSTYIVARSDRTFNWSYFTTEMGCELIDTTTDRTTN